MLTTLLQSSNSSNEAIRVIICTKRISKPVILVLWDPNDKLQTSTLQSSSCGSFFLILRNLCDTLAQKRTHQQVHGFPHKQPTLDLNGPGKGPHTLVRIPFKKEFFYNHSSRFAPLPGVWLLMWFVFYLNRWSGASISTAWPQLPERWRNHNYIHSQTLTHSMAIVP